MLHQLILPESFKNGQQSVSCYGPHILSYSLYPFQFPIFCLIGYFSQPRINKLNSHFVLLYNYKKIYNNLTRVRHKILFKKLTRKILLKYNFKDPLERGTIETLFSIIFFFASSPSPSFFISIDIVTYRDTFFLLKRRRKKGWHKCCDASEKVAFSTVGISAVTLLKKHQHKST